MSMKASEQLEQKILGYIDNTLSENERQEFERILITDTQLKQRVEQLRDLGSVFKTDKLQQPSLNFTQNVMANLQQYPLQNQPIMLNSILLLFGVLVLVGLCTALLYFGVFDQSHTSINLNSVGLINRYIHKTLPSIPVDGKVIVNTVIFLNLALALMVLDRAVLKPVFQRRMHT
jgi:hypothetical protein